MRRLRFDDITRNRLSALLRDALLKGGCFHPDEIEFELGVMLGIMENYARAIPKYQELEPESQQRRRERIESLAAHIDGAIEQLIKLDDAALGFAAWKGFEEVSNADGLPNIFPDCFATIQEAYLWRKKNVHAMTAFSLGVRKAAVELPQHSMNTSGKDSPWYLLPTELSTAMAIERLFLENTIKFTVSNSGLAAECLRAVYALGGMNIDRVDYWLKRARDHFDSNHNLVERLRKRTDE